MPRSPQPANRKAHPRLRLSFFALAAAAVLAPGGTWALDLAQSPPGNAEPYVRPNVIISIDDSGSMARKVTGTANGTASITEPKSDGTWSPDAQRINVLKYALKQVFNDHDLLSESKIRLAWQAMWNGSGAAVTKQNPASSAPSASPGVGAAMAYNFPGYGDTTYSSSKGANSVLAGVGDITTADTNSIANVPAATYGINTMQLLDARGADGKTHRQNFLDFVDQLTLGSGTPSHAMMAMADRYMRLPLSKDGPWASEPGKTEKPYLACRRNYHIFLTDGRWNGQALPIPDKDQRDNSTNLELPDGNTYRGNASDQTRLYWDSDTVTTTTNKWGNTTTTTTPDNTLADWAFYSWATPLQTSGFTDQNGKPQAADYYKTAVEPGVDYRRAPATETFGTGKNAVDLRRYWNPKYDPATWPHMVTYTIGFSNEATTWPDAPAIKKPSDDTPFNFDGSFPDFVTGAIKWPSMKSGTKDTESGAGGVRSLDLWHAALNSRGRFYAVNKAGDLVNAFKDIFAQINTPPPSNPVASATSGSNVTRVNVDRFTATYEPINAWKGYVRSEIIQPDGTIVDNPAWGTTTEGGKTRGTSTADKLDQGTPGDRVILTWGDGKGGVPLRWKSDESNLSNAQKLWLEKDIGGNTATPSKGEQRLNYIRGDRKLEGKEGTTGYSDEFPFRHRASVQGDIVNSVIWYTGAPSSTYALPGYTQFVRDNKSRAPMIYVGGNDGMLHGFAAKDGTETLAYVPRGVIPTLNWLTDPAFDETHHFYVDGSPMTGDVDWSGAGTDWRTLLVGTLGAGGKGYFVLDVTNPGGSESASGPAFAEASASDLVVVDRSLASSTFEPLNCDPAAGDTGTCAENKDMGFITARPVLSDDDGTRSTQITRMNNGRWAAIFGNGYNSTNRRPVLLIQYLDGSKELVRVPATTETQATCSVGAGKTPPAGCKYVNNESGLSDNGLASPRVVDLNGDGRADIVYAGDNFGNLWKFDLTSGSSSEWGVAFSGTPLFTAKGPASLGESARNQTQPITTAPSVRANDRASTQGPVGGLMVAFGTGRDVDLNDPSDVGVQTLYSVLDNTRYQIRSADLGKPRDQQRLEVNPGDCTGSPTATCVPAPKTLGTGVTAAKLIQQEIESIAVDSSAGAIKTTGEQLTPNTWGDHNGWYMDFPEVGERLLKPMAFFDATNILAVYSQVPAKGRRDIDTSIESCESVSPDNERQYRTFINIMDGKAPSVQLVDYDGDGAYNAADKGVVRIEVSAGAHNLITRGDRVMDIDTQSNAKLLARMPEQSVRPSWRQLR